jgi:hypothetical protein
MAMTWNLLTGMLLAGVTTVALSAPSAACPPAQSLHGGYGPANPYMARDGVGATHSDSYSSDAAPLAGPGAGPITAGLTVSNALCSTLLLDRQGRVVAYCINHANSLGELLLLDPDTLAPLTTMTLPPIGAFGGFYLYLDEQDRVVIGDGRNHVTRMAHTQDTTGAWSFHITDDWDVSALVTGHCGTPACDYIESVTPDFTGRIWFSTRGGVIGTISPATSAATAIQFPSGEGVENSLSSAPSGVAVPTDHALYLLRARPDGTPYVVSRQTYDRGTHQKPGQLSWGTGTTPVFFGAGGDRYVAITDNADVQEHLLVYRINQRTGATTRICQVPLWQPYLSADEIAPIGIGRSVIIENTYNYDYNPSAPITSLPGGLSRIDVRPDGRGCDTAWTNPVPTDAEAKLSTGDGYVYTTQRTTAGTTTRYDLVVIDSGTGKTVSTKPLGTGRQWETDQLSGVNGRGDVLYQGTIAGIIRIRPNGQ